MHVRRIHCYRPAAAFALIICGGLSGCGGAESELGASAEDFGQVAAVPAAPFTPAATPAKSAMSRVETSMFDGASSDAIAIAADTHAYDWVPPSAIAGGAHSGAYSRAMDSAIGTTGTVTSTADRRIGKPATTKSSVSSAAMTTMSPSATGSSPKALAAVGSDAFRFLTQATFGPSPMSLAELESKTYVQWLDDQMATPWRTLMPRVKAQLEVPTSNPSQYVVSAFWREAIEGTAQLRWRTAYALSQIFVYSVSGNAGYSYPLASADYFDMLAGNAFGNYRLLLESVARHPAMGRYLSHLGNRPADDSSGRVPDENFAREIMQLFSIGLYKLKADGTQQLDGRGMPIPTYDADDVAGLARVFTGWSWDCGDGRSSQCFLKTPHKMGDTAPGMRPMVGYGAYHSADEKRFLGVVIPAQSAANPEASLKVALDTLANHPNVGPFIGRQLIQRFVTSNPSPSYVAEVAAVFNDNGRGVRGDLGAVVRKILTHSEARTPGASLGKVREPVLRLTALARAFAASSVSGDFRFPSSEVYDVAIGQIPLSSPSVFNYYRPGYVARGGGLARLGMVTPEMQIVDENSVASYVRYMRQAVEKDFGAGNEGSTGRDMQLDLSAALSLADRPDQMIDHIFGRLLGDGSYSELRSEVLQTVNSIAIPPPVKGGTSDWAIGVAKTKRMRMAMLMTLSAAEFIVQH